MQVTLEIWCHCGLKMEISANNFATCQDERCSDVLNLPVDFNRHNGQLTPEQVVALAEQIEMMHQADKKVEEEEPWCYVGCTCKSCWPDEPAPSWE